jgi:Omp85 superfamily domain/POTRA domain, FtsQ-type
LALSTAPAHAQDQKASSRPAAGPASDLDQFMEKVLARREVNRTVLNQYVLDETEAFEVLGPGRWPLHRQKRDFTWYARDGMHVRSPVRFNGVVVGETARRTYEADWITREKERQEKKARKEPERKEIAIGSDGLQVSGGGVASTEPSFVSEAYFMDFKFEPGNYYLAGREKLEGHDVLRIEYYPTRLFNESDDEKRPKEMKKKSDEPKEADIERKMNKTALVTLWVDAAEHQIVKYTFDNVWLDFLPGAWFVRIDDLHASMTMGQPFAGVWLPRAMAIHAGVTLATGSFEAGYDRSFTNYREAEVTTTIKVPKLESRGPERPGVVPEETAARAGHGPFVDDEQAVEVIREVRVHGNASLTDAEVLTLAGVAVGEPLTPTAEKEIEQRLKNSRRFETVDVRKRYRSLDDPTDVAIVLVVHERPGVRSAEAGGTGQLPTAWRRVASRLMFFPILNYADGYGLTYGGRVSTVDLLGAGERLSVPLTWGGTQRAALELERTFKTGPLTRVLSSVGISNRENPHFNIDDQRVELTGRAERQFARLFRTGIEATRSSVSFGQLDDHLWTIGADAALDTRGDPGFPGNAVLLGGGWSALHVKGLEKINRYNADARGYLRVFRQNVLAGRLQYFTSEATLPPYERLLLGGSNLRGFRAGAFDGDRMVITSGELRAPITSVLKGAKLGVTVFVDAAKAVDFGASLGDAEWHRAAGAGLFLIASPVRLNLDVAHGFSGGTRVSLGTGFSF